MHLRALVWVAALLVAAVPVPASAAVNASLDFQDLEGDVIVDPRSGPAYIGERPSVDFKRVTQTVEGDEIVLSLAFSHPPGEPNAHIEVIASAASGFRSGTTFGFRWDGTGTLESTRYEGGITHEGETVAVNTTLTNASNTLTFRIQGVPESAPCFVPVTISFKVRAGNAEYGDWFYPPVSPCDENDILDGAQGECRAVQAPEEDPLAVELDDPERDVHVASVYSPDSTAAPDERNHDITRFESRRDGNRVVQSVTLAEPRNASKELQLEIIHRLSGGQNLNDEPSNALIVRYWRFENGTQADRVEGEIRDGTNDVNRPRFYVEMTTEGSTLTFTWCASVVPTDAPCLAIEVQARDSGFFTPGLRDQAHPAVDPCAGATAGKDAGDAMEEEIPTDDETMGEEEFQDEETGGNESPGLGLLALLVVLVAVAASRRR